MKDNAHNFPIKLHSLLDAEDPDVVCWTSTGNAFRINDMDRFRDEALPKYWRHTKMTSFQRQMNLYGFKKINHGDDIGAYYHPLFVRGKRGLLSDFKRSAIKSSAMEAELGFISTTAEKSLNKMDNSSAAMKEFPERTANEFPSLAGQKRQLFSQIDSSRDLEFQSDFHKTSRMWTQVLETRQFAPMQPFPLGSIASCGDDLNKRQRAYSESVDDLNFEFDIFFDRLNNSTGGCEFGLSGIVDDSLLFDPVVVDSILSDEEYLLLMECE